MTITIKNGRLFNIQRDFGVYLLRCIPENRIYIGSTKQSFRARFSNHYKFLSQGNLRNKKLQEDFNLYGKDNFEFEILGVYPENMIVYYENRFMRELSPYYNVIKASNNSKTNLNRKFSDAHKEKIREKAKQYRHNSETLNRLTILNKQNSALYKLTNSLTGEILTQTYKEAVVTTGVSDFRRKSKKNIWKIEKLRKQAKTIYLFVNNSWLEFSSFEKCDKFLNKWRGYTSTKMLRNCVEIDGYKVKIEQ